MGNHTEKAEKKIRSTQHIEEAPVINPRMEKISHRFRIAKIAAFMLLALYFFLMIVIFRERITIENFQYLMRSFDPGRIVSSDADGTISYLAGKETVFVPYRGGLAMQSKDGLRLVDGAGNQTYVERDVRKNAVLASSGKYLLAYDRVSGAYSLYNAFSRVKTEKLSQRISDHWMADSGAFALCLAPSGELCEFRVYSEQLGIRMSVRRNGYPACVSMNPDGSETMAVYYACTDAGNYRTTVEFLDTKSGERKRSCTYEGALVLDGAETQDGGALLLTTNGVVRITPKEKCEELCSFTQSGQSLLRYALTSDGVCTVCTLDGDKNAVSVSLFASDGTLSQRRYVGGTVTDVSGCGEYFAILGSGGVTVLKNDGTFVPELPDAEIIAILCDRDGLYLCGYTRAYRTRWDDLPAFREDPKNEAEKPKGDS